jgi:general L-amino acid transport system permease protein
LTDAAQAVLTLSVPQDTPASPALKPPRPRPSFRRVLTTAVFLAAVILAAAFLVRNLGQNLAARGLSVSFDFMLRPAGFDIPIRAIPFTPRDTYLQAALVGISNTLLVSALAVVTATVLGFLSGAALLSRNPLLARTALWFVDVVRNTPQLLVLLFVYTVFLRALPSARDSLSLGDMAFLNVRGLFLPALAPGPSRMPSVGLSLGTWALILTATAPIVLFLPLRLRRRLFLALATIAAGAALAAFLLTTGAWQLERPVLRGFNFRGGLQIVPEFVALWIGLAIYAAAFIADLVRGAVLAVPRGQEEAAAAVGLSPAQTLWLVRVPQALRILVPPLISQYLNVIKSSTLGLAVAYPEIMAVVAGTTLNQTGHAIETMLIVMVFFLALNLLISFLINLYNRRLIRRM